VLIPSFSQVLHSISPLSFQKAIEINPSDSEIRDKLYKVRIIIKAKEKIKELPITHREISLNKIGKKTRIDKEDLEKLIEMMIREGDLYAKIAGESLIFEDILSRGMREISEVEKEIFFGRGGVWEANIFKFKVKIQNNSENVITDILVLLERLPSGLQVIGERTRTIETLKPNGGLLTPEFKLNAGNECISGEINASIKYYDYQGNPHSIEIRPFEISYICPLMEAKEIEEIEYLRKTRNMFTQEKKIEFEENQDIIQFMNEIKRVMEDMNLAIINIEGASNEISGYAEDKIKHDGLALETKIKSMIDSQTEIIIKAICENENKCSPLLFKIIQEINQLQLSLDKEIIMQKLDLFIDKPRDLNNYIKKVINSDWSDEKKDKWAETIQEILEDWKSIKPKNWKIIGKALLNFLLGRVVGDELAGLLTTGIYNLIEWIKSNMEK